MAIYSCSVSTIGRSTHAPGTAGAHMRYIGREDAASLVEAAHMPHDPQEARVWMDAQERAARKNARLCSKVRLALPRELTREENAELVRDFLGRLAGGRVPTIHAIHDKGKDAHNPHAHVVLIDRDVETGKRVLRLSDSPKDRIKAGLPENGVEWIRTAWETAANEALERAGHPERIDRRTLEAQGIGREPTIHIGPRARHVENMVQRPASKARPSPTPRHPDRVIDYPAIDNGRTRLERHAEIVDLNLERAARSSSFEVRSWAQFEKEQRAKDRPLERERVAAARRRTADERRIRHAFRLQARAVRERWKAESRLKRDWTRQRFAPEAAQLKAGHQQQRDELRLRQGAMFARIMAVVDFTGGTKRRREAMRRELSARQAAERKTLAETVRELRQQQAEALHALYAPQLETLRKGRRFQIGKLREAQREEVRQEDARQQEREADREQARQATERGISLYRKMHEGKEDSTLAEGWNRKDAEPPREQTPEERRAAVLELMKRRHGKGMERE